MASQSRLAAGGGLVVLTWGIEADHGVEVDDAACLVFGHLDEPDTELSKQGLLRNPGQPGKMPGQVGDEPAPQVARVSVEQHGRLVVVALRAHRLAEPGSPSTCRVGQEMSQPWQQRRALASRRGWQYRTVLPRIRREWTGPNDGA